MVEGLFVEVSEEEMLSVNGGCGNSCGTIKPSVPSPKEDKPSSSSGWKSTAKTIIDGVSSAMLQEIVKTALLLL